jgi:hypothetical protein
MFGLALALSRTDKEEVAACVAQYDKAVKPLGNVVLGSCPLQRHSRTSSASSSLMAYKNFLVPVLLIGRNITSTCPLSRLATVAPKATTHPPLRKVMAKGG